MGLVLNVREGHGFTVGADEFVINKVLGPASYELTRSRDAKVFTVDDELMVEIATDVMVGGQQSTRGAVKVVIDAPREYQISRGIKNREPV